MDIGPDQLFQDALSGDPAPLAAAFTTRAGTRTPLLRLLLAAASDAPVAACHALIWQDVGADANDGLLGLLRWYLREEALTTQPARRAVHREELLRVLSWEALPRTEAGFDLVFSAVRTVTGLPVSLAVHGLAARTLRHAADAWFKREPQSPRPVMIYAALGTMDLGLVRRFIALAGPERSPDLRHAIDWGLAQLIAAQGGPDDWLVQRILAEQALDPQSPASVHRVLWLAMLQDRQLRDFIPMLHAMRLDRDEQQLKVALNFAHAMAQQQEAEAEVRWIEQQLRVLDPTWPGAALPAEADAEAGDTARRDGDSGPIAAMDLPACIAHANRLAETDLSLRAAMSPQKLAQTFDQLAAAILKAVVPAGWSFGHFLEASEAVRQLTLRQFGWVVHFVQAPHAGGRPEHGTLDLRFFPVLHRGLLRVAAAICQAGIAWVEAGNGAAGGWALARLVQTHSAAALEADDTQAAHAFLDRLGTSGAMVDLLAVARDDTRLRAQEVAAARAAAPPARLGSAVHPFQPRLEWTQAEGLACQILAGDPVLRGQFDILWPDGALRTYPHETPARDVLLIPAPDLSVIAEGLLIGPRGTMLKPDPYHTSLNYPIESLVVLAGQGRAVRIRPQATSRVADRVLVLDGLASLHWPNYYHWMITHLSRVAFAAELGLLDRRKVVLPEGMRAWTLESLDLIGVDETRRMIVPPSHLVQFADAAILSSVEHLSPATIQALRRRLLGPGAAAMAPPQGGPALYLSRRNRALRKLDNEDEIEALARDMGFEVITPEDYSIARQRVLFASARGIAAPEGAALTNMVFAAPGTRTLSILCQNDMMPIYNDLAVVLGQSHRKLAGAGIDSTADSSRFQPHYRIAPDLARRAFAWVLGGRDD